VPRPWQRGLQGGLCEERPGLPSARHGWLQTAATEPHRRAWLSPADKVEAPLGKQA